ncbi:MAG: hypothetical protein ACTS73_09730 [Arsenophonus sp. NEOnobi-MAG3]
MICHEKYIIQLSAKSDITCDPLHELIRKGTRQLIAIAAFRLKLEAMLI